MTVKEILAKLIARVELLAVCLVCACFAVALTVVGFFLYAKLDAIHRDLLVTQNYADEMAEARKLEILHGLK